MSHNCNNDNNLCYFIPKCLEYTVCTKKLYFWKHKPESVFGIILRKRTATFYWTLTEWIHFVSCLFTANYKLVLVSKYIHRAQIARNLLLCCLISKFCLNLLQSHGL